MSTLEELRAVLAAYDATGDYWSAVCATAEEERRAETVSEAVAYSERLEEHAHAFAARVRALLEQYDEQARIDTFDEHAAIIAAEGDPWDSGEVS